jgi:hypothetical protein
MGIVIVLCIVALAVLLMPDAFGAIASAVVNNPEWGIPFLAVVFLIVMWLYKR